MATTKKKSSVKKKSTAKKATAKKTVAKKSVARVAKAPAKKAAPKKAAAKKAVKKTVKPAVKAAPKTVKQTAAKITNTTMGASVPAFEEAFTFGNNVFEKMFSQAPALPQGTEAFDQFSKQGAEQLAKASDAASRALNDVVELSKDNVEAYVECGNIASGAGKYVGSEIMSYANKTFSDQVEMSKELFSCRTLNDMFDLQSKMLKNNLDGFFSESVKLSEMMFAAASSAAEPLQERMEVTAERVTKSMVNAA